MLDGKKSYLISITALFSKKGYELAFGTDMILDTQRDTRYHLSAPVNSTYRTLRQDTLKNASKAPYSATSLFGRDWKEAAIAGEFEGQTVEAVHSTIVSYLSDIHRHFRGEIRQKAQRPSRSTTPEARWKMGGKIHSMEYADSIQQGDRQKSVQADFIVNAVQEKDAISQMRPQAETSNDAYEFANVVPAYEGLLDAGSVSEQRQGNGSPSSESAIHGETVKQGDTAEQQTVIQQIFQDRATVVELPVAAEGLAMESIFQPAAEALPHRTDIRDALIETSRPSVKEQILDSDEINALTKAGKLEQAVGTTPNDLLETEARAKNDHAPVEARMAKSDKNVDAFIDWQMLVEQRQFKDSTNEQSTAASMRSGTGAGHERMRATELKQDKFMMIHESATGNRIYLPDATESQGMLEAEHGIFSIQPENTSSITADPTMGSITGSPEMGTLSEGIRSVYGEYATEMGEAGMENILPEGLQHVDVPAAPSSIESVIHRMQETSNGGSLEGIQGHSIVGSMEFSDRTIGVQTETVTSGLASSSGNSLNEPMSVASRNSEQVCPASPDQYRVASTCDDSKVVPEEQSITASIHSSADADNEYLSSGIPEHHATLDESQRGERVLVSQEGELDDLGSARLNGLELEGQYEELLAADVLREIIADSPEISKMARMLRIMYGEQAMELIEAGIENIVAEAVQEGTTQTSIHQITDSVIHQLETSLASGSLEAVQIRSDQANIEHSEGALQASAEQGSRSSAKEGLLINFESGNSFSSYEGAYHAMGGDAERHMSAEAEIEALDKAFMSSESTNAITQDMETGRTFSSTTGVTESMEQGILSGSLLDGEYSHLERAAMSTGNLDAAESGPLESAQYIGELEAEKVALVPAERTSIESLEAEEVTLTPSERVSIVSLEAERSEVTTGELLELTKEADVTSSEHALVCPDIQEGVISSGTYADNQEHNQVSDAILLDGDQAVSMESVQETIIDQIDRADSIMRTNETVVEQTNGTGSQVENVLEAIWIHQERASGEEKEYIGVRDGLETAQPGDISSMVDMQELEQGQAIEKTLPAVIPAHTAAEPVFKIEETELHAISEGTRKKKVMSTRIEAEHQQAARKRKVIKTQITDAEDGIRLKKTAAVRIEAPESAKRHKILKTVIEAPSEATNQSIPVMPKRKIWMIMGKIASWNIWNWKKTR
ncbi:hypothetical protein P4H61_02930 [Paenibacillus peoriae]|uniref:hypothetical protein n=1 Tax=Paenibacillus peoriae TaxID=59893 RepID=UPI00026C5961|nr:hypothetical protein [Paenibacillus peoriae]MEC0180448.1 hypothetical protein [Paenibacillus peoriae]